VIPRSCLTSSGSVGLEDPDELIADIKYALKEAFNESIPHTIER
ncbi:hypothetical protein, partial [Staphylococcus aureus]